MKAYRAILSAQFRVLLQYRVAALAGIGTQLFFGLVRVMIFTAFFHSTTQPQPIDLPTTITYLWLVQAFLAMLPWGGSHDIRRMVLDGSVAYEMLRPVDLYNLWFMRALAQRGAPVILRCVPIFLLAGLFLGLQPPPSLASAGAFVLAMGAALLLSGAITTLINITLLWTISGEGLGLLLPAAVMLFSGFLIPLPLFPDWLQPALRAMPFRGLMDLPFRLYAGHIPPAELGWVLAHQITWTGLLILSGRWLLSIGKRRLVVQGG